MDTESQIMELFEDFLEEKNISIPCDDEEEERMRYEDENAARIYGMEYYNLSEKIEELLSNRFYN